MKLNKNFKFTKKNINFNKTKKNLPKLNKKTSKFRKFNCAPGKNNEYTCYDNNSLNIIKNLWNIKHPDDKINDKNPKQIWLKLKDKFSNICNNEFCWLNAEFIKNKINKKLLKSRFAPFHPNHWNIDKNAWLSSTDIIKVMKGYENNYKNFNFIGPSPIDFDSKISKNSCVYNELCNFNLEKFIKKNINKIGFIFNTDPHYKSGSHWIALYLDVKKNIIFYFDSNGDIIPQQIKKLSNRIIEQGKSLNIDLKYDDNHKINHQKSNTECGMYCLYFIISLLKEQHNIDYFKKNRIKDEYVENFRKIYFNDPKYN